MLGLDDLESNLRKVQGRIAEAAKRAGRDPADITLVAVTKTVPQRTVRDAYDLGLRDFGENRVEEAEVRMRDLPADITWHMIGHIQSRKAARVASVCHFVHAVDSVKLARRLDRTCAEYERRMPVLLEINISGESTKYGFPADRWTADSVQQTKLLTAIREITALPNLQVCGLMTMAPIVADPGEARPVFAALGHLREDLAQAFPKTRWLHLSMGMTDDFEIAIEEGASMVRVGRAIFGPRQAQWRGCEAGGK